MILTPLRTLQKGTNLVRVRTGAGWLPFQNHIINFSIETYYVVVLLSNNMIRFSPCASIATCVQTKFLNVTQETMYETFQWQESTRTLFENWH
jgi:hypothetical protein